MTVPSGPPPPAGVRPDEERPTEERPPQTAEHWRLANRWLARGALLAAGFLAGALIALLLTNTEFTIIALIGIILLIGIVKKNAIMMIDFALEAERKEGKSPRDAIREAYGLDHDPGPEELVSLAESWRPFRTWVQVMLRALGNRTTP